MVKSIKIFVLLIIPFLLLGQSEMDQTKWEIHISPNVYFPQISDIELLNGSKIISRYGISGSAYIMRNFYFKNPDKMNLSFLLGFSIYPLLDIKASLLPPSIKEEFLFLGDLYVKESQFVKFDSWLQYNYSINKFSKIVTAFGIGIIPFDATVSHSLDFIDDSLGRYSVLRYEAKYNKYSVISKMKIGVLKDFKIRDFKFSVGLNYIRSFNSIATGTLNIRDSENSFHTEDFKLYLNYIELNIGIPLKKKKRIKM